MYKKDKTQLQGNKLYYRANLKPASTSVFPAAEKRQARVVNTSSFAG